MRVFKLIRNQKSQTSQKSVVVQPQGSMHERTCSASVQPRGLRVAAGERTGEQRSPRRSRTPRPSFRSGWRAARRTWTPSTPSPTPAYDYSGPLVSPIQTNVPGIKICQLLPLLAQQADKYSLIRSMTHGDNGHETAAYVMQTGHVPSDDVVYPSLGVLVSYFKGYDHGYKSVIPPYVVLTASLGRFNEVGFLGQRYKPFVTGGNPNQPVFAVEGIFTLGISDQRQRDRRDLMHALDSLGKAMPGNPAFELLDRCEENAEATLGDARKLFDLSQEKPELRDRYGRTQFGQSCLMARRLVERGVPYITINYGGWDDHDQNLRKTAAAAAGPRQGPVDALAGPLRPRPARQHDRLVLRRVRAHAQAGLGPALERRPEPLGQLFLRPRRRRRIQGRPRRRRVRRERRVRGRAARLSARPARQHLRTARH